MSWETNTGPLTTEDEAWSFVDEILDAWPSTRPREGTLDDYVKTMCRLPKRYVELALDSIRGEGRAFAPNPGEIESEVRGIWPLKDCTGEGQRMAAERARRAQEGQVPGHGNGQQQRAGAGVAQR